MVFSALTRANCDSEVQDVEHAISLTVKTIIDMVDGFFRLLPNLLIGGLVFFVFTRLAQYVRKIVVSIGSHAHLDMTLCQALGSLSSVATSVFGLLIAATIVIPSFKASQLIAGLGITSVAVGFAFKDILQNFFAGLLLLWQKPFRIGDQIRTKDFEGTVEQIDIHSTRIITNNGQLVVLPNGDVFTNPIIINTAYERLRQHLTVTGLPNMHIDEARGLVAKAVQATEGVVQDPAPQVFVTTVEDSTPKFEVYFWCKPKEAEVLMTTDRVATTLRKLIKETVASVASLATAPAPEATTTIVDDNAGSQQPPSGSQSAAAGHSVGNQYVAGVVPQSTPVAKSA